MTNKLWLSGINVKDEREELGLLHTSGRPKVRELSESEKKTADNAARNSKANERAYQSSVKAEALLRKKGETGKADAIEATRDLHLDLI